MSASRAIDRLIDARGRTVVLGAEFARGGEAALFDLAGRPELVAKLYLDQRDRATAEKLAAMIAMTNNRLSALCAWPVATLHRPGGAIAGFVMPKLTGYRPVYNVYGPKLRLRQFPRADWRFLVHTAANVARAFAAVHAMGLVVGDVNQDNLFVGADATVRFIDTDSMQVTQGGRVWRCEVGVSTHQPPEMQGLASYRDVTRTANHDAFGLAVMVFQLLCLGRHPFAGRFAGAGEPPAIDAAIAQSRYAYAADSARTQMSPPVGSVPVTALPAEIQALFEAAFAPPAARRTRPPAERWVAELTRLGNSVRRCAVNAGHWYAEAAGACPWCEVETRSGAALFPAVFVAGRAGGGIVLLWQEIEAVPEPAPMPPLQPPETRSVHPSPWVKAAMRRRRVHKYAVAAAAVALLALVALAVELLPAAAIPLLLVTMAAAAGAAWWLRSPLEAAEARAALRGVSQRWADLEQRWRPGPAAQFAATRRRLADLKREHDALPQRRDGGGVASDQRQQQLRAHLESFEIASAKVPGVGRAKVSTLVSYGIETAADIDPARIEPIPGFGPKTAAALLAFRQSCEASFRFEVRRSAPAHTAAIDGTMEQRREMIETELTAGLAQLKTMVVRERRHRSALEQRAMELAPVYAQALADARALGVAR